MKLTCSKKLISRLSRQVICIFVILVCYREADAQHHRLTDIQKIKLDDFQGKRNGNKYPVYISINLLYRIDSVTKISNEKFRVKVITLVRINKSESFFDLSGVKENEVEEVLLHEQGHVSISYISANLVERDLSSPVYGPDYKKVIESQFYGVSQRYLRLNQVYDDQTEHSRNLEAQKKWNQKMEILFNETLDKQNQ